MRTSPSTSRFAVPFLALLALQACASGSPQTPAPVGPPPPEVHWVRTAAEHRAIFEEVYRWAGERVAAATADRSPGTWAVILDVDETVLDNSEYEARLWRQGVTYTPDSWNAWVHEASAPALPGAKRFIDGVRSRGGRVVLVTNRDDALCDATRENLVAQRVEADLVLCRPPGVERKEARFRAVQDGTASSSLPALDVVAWVGDNIRDFPGGEQALRDGDPVALASFGVRWFVLPNPMYGSWQDNPPR